MVTSDGATDNSCFDSRQGLGIFLFSSTSRLTLDVTQLLFGRYRVTLLGVMWLGCKFDSHLQLMPGLYISEDVPRHYTMT